MLVAFDCNFDVGVEVVSIVDEVSYTCDCVAVVCFVDRGDEEEFEDLEC